MKLPSIGDWGGLSFYWRRKDTRRYRKPILEAVLYNNVYDPQINGIRADYLFDVIHATGEPEYYARHIRQAVRMAGSADYDYYNLYEIAGRLAKNGDLLARKAMYEGLPERLDDGFAVGIRQLIQRDGVTAYAVIAERLMAYGPDDQALKEKHHYIPLSYLSEQYGEAGFPTAIEMVRQENPHLTGYLTRLLVVYENWKRENDRRRCDSRTPRTYESVRAYIDRVEGARYIGPLSFAKLEEGIRRHIARELLVETNPERLIRYLRLFTDSPFPVDHTPLFALTHHEHNKVSHLAYAVLEQVTHPSVRACALEMCDARIPDKSYCAIRLLTNNPGEGDLERITALSTGVTEEEQIHRLYLATRRYLETNLTKDAIPLLSKMYAETPCATCRGGIVDLLDELNALPDWLCEEGVYDAESGIREVTNRGKYAQN